MFCCRGKRLANYLLENGSTIRRIEMDRNNDKFLVFLFENDETLNHNLQKWKTDKNTYAIHKQSNNNLEEDMESSIVEEDVK